MSTAPMSRFALSLGCDVRFPWNKDKVPSLDSLSVKRGKELVNTTALASSFNFTARKILAEQQKTSDWDVRRRGLCERRESRPYSYWVDDNGVRNRTDGQPAQVFDDGTLLWCLNGEIHREDAPAYTDALGRRSWYWGGFPASFEVNKLLNAVYSDGNLSEPRADAFLGLAAECMDHGHSATNGFYANYDFEGIWTRPLDTEVSHLPNTVQWVSLVIARHRSPRLSEEYRTLVGLRSLAEA